MALNRGCTAFTRRLRRVSLTRLLLLSATISFLPMLLHLSRLPVAFSPPRPIALPSDPRHEHKRNQESSSLPPELTDVNMQSVNPDVPDLLPQMAADGSHYLHQSSPRMWGNSWDLNLAAPTSVVSQSAPHFEALCAGCRAHMFSAFADYRSLLPSQPLAPNTEKTAAYRRGPPESNQTHTGEEEEEALTEDEESLFESDSKGWARALRVLSTALANLASLIRRLHRSLLSYANTIAEGDARAPAPEAAALSLYALVFAPNAPTRWPEEHTRLSCVLWYVQLDNNNNNNDKQNRVRVNANAVPFVSRASTVTSASSTRKPSPSPRPSRDATAGPQLETPAPDAWASVSSAREEAQRSGAMQQIWWARYVSQAALRMNTSGESLNEMLSVRSSRLSALSVPASVVPMMDYFHERHFAWGRRFLECKLPAEAMMAAGLPVAVSISMQSSTVGESALVGPAFQIRYTLPENPEAQKQTSNSEQSLKVNSNSRESSPKYAKQEVNTESEHRKSDPDTFAVCTSNLLRPPADPIGSGGEFVAERFVEYVELNRVLGAAHVFLYVTEQRNATFPTLARYLEHYSRTGFLDVFPMRMRLPLPPRLQRERPLRSRESTFSFSSSSSSSSSWSWYSMGRSMSRDELELARAIGWPVDHPRTIQPLALTDCGLRALGHYRYVVNTDLDEFIVPRRHDSWQQLAENYLRAEPASEYIFRNTFFHPFYPDDPDAMVGKDEHNDTSSSRQLRRELSTRLITPLKRYREPRVFDGCVRSKVVARTEDVLVLGIHQVLQFHRRAPLSHYALHTFWNADVAEDCLKGPERSHIVPARVALVHHYRAWHNESSESESPDSSLSRMGLGSGFEATGKTKTKTKRKLEEVAQLVCSRDSRLGSTSGSNEEPLSLIFRIDRDNVHGAPLQVTGSGEVSRAKPAPNGEWHPPLHSVHTRATRAIRNSNLMQRDRLQEPITWWCNETLIVRDRSIERFAARLADAFVRAIVDATSASCAID